MRHWRFMQFMILISLLCGLYVSADTSDYDECGEGQSGCYDYTTARTCIYADYFIDSWWEWDYTDCSFGYYCSNAECTLACGNGRVDNRTSEWNANYMEICDDGNSLNNDGCNDNCGTEQGYICKGEPSVCAKSCGNGRTDANEQCDDMNLVNSDGCNSLCQIEQGYYCAGQPSVCSKYCGNGRLDATEQCDDGNKINGDCCSAVCRYEDLGKLDCGIGECRNSTNKCINGKMAFCTPRTQSLETCDGKDNDCDSFTDDNLTAPNCPLIYGVCQGTKKICGGNLGWLNCTQEQYGQYYQSPETSCDGKDNNCNNRTDENLVMPCTDYLTCGVYYSCSECPAPPEENCDGTDNNCNGQVDEVCNCLSGLEQNCGYNDIGNCRMGTQACVYGNWTECIGSVLPQAEICDMEDNDCDGIVDEGLQNHCVDPNTCSSFDFCGSCPEIPIEACDDIDNDCDGMINENLSDCCLGLGDIIEGCTDDEKCPGIMGRKTCSNYEWTKCNADCPIEINKSLFSNINELDSFVSLPLIRKHETICEGTLTKTLDLTKYEGDCQYKTDRMEGFSAATKELKIEFVVGTNELSVKCGNIQQEIIYDVSVDPGCNSSTTIADFKQVINEFLQEGIISEDEKKMAEQTAKLVSEKTSYSLRVNDAIVTHSITTKENIPEMEYMLSIPKECANDTSSIKFYLPDYKIIKEDPLIAWHFTDVDDKIDLSYRLTGSITKECLSKIRGLPIGKVGNAREKNLSMFLPFALFAVLMLAGVYTYISRNYPDSIQFFSKRDRQLEKERYQLLEKINSLGLKSKEEVVWYMKREGTDADTIKWIMGRF